MTVPHAPYAEAAKRTASACCCSRKRACACITAFFTYVYTVNHNMK